MALNNEVENDNDNQTENPWYVDSMQDFWFMKCPECIFETREEDIFQAHAIGNHPKSCVFFDFKPKEKEDVKESIDKGEEISKSVDLKFPP